MLFEIIRLASVVVDVAGKLSHHSIIVGCIITCHIANLPVYWPSISQWKSKIVNIHGVPLLQYQSI